MKLIIQRAPILSEGSSTVQAAVIVIDEKRARLDFVQSLDVEMLLTNTEAVDLVKTLNQYRDYFAYIDGWMGNEDTDRPELVGINVSWGKTALEVKERVSLRKRTFTSSRRSRATLAAAFAVGCVVGCLIHQFLL
jgi:hypothetical protein